MSGSAKIVRYIFYFGIAHEWSIQLFALLGGSRFSRSVGRTLRVDTIFQFGCKGTTFFSHVQIKKTFFSQKSKVKSLKPYFFRAARKS